MTFLDLPAFLLWIVAGGGAMTLTGYVEAYLLENWPAWHNFPLAVKILVPIVLAAVFGAVAQSVLALDLLASVPPIVSVVLLSMVNWIMSQKAYRSIKDSSYAIEAHAIANDAEDTLIIEDDGSPIE